jgi:regulator of cell morphogenesis and NO signaling
MKVMSEFAQKTLAEIVSRAHATAPILERYQLDFCCKGKRTLALACSEKGLVLEEVELEIEKAVSGSTGLQEQMFLEMSNDQLIAYILLKHHFYVKQNMPVIYAHMEKVAMKHGDRYPHMRQAYLKFAMLKSELESHLEKEEQILFPRIRHLEIHSDLNSASIQEKAHLIEAPVSIMESEHDHAGALMQEIRRLTNDFTPPEDACTTHRLCMQELREFEEDLHRHVHLENNILFPRAAALVRAGS